MLYSDGKCNLRHEAHRLDFRDTANELISPADLAEITASLADVAGLGCAVKKLIDLLFWDTMVTASGLDGANLHLVDPLLERGIANAEDLSGFAWRE